LSGGDIVEMKVNLFEEKHRVGMQCKSLYEATNSVCCSKETIGIKRKEKLWFMA